MSASPSIALVIFFSLSPGAKSQERAVTGSLVTGISFPFVIPDVLRDRWQSFGATSRATSLVNTGAGPGASPG
ncbi:hypothetical protein GCM10011494_07910 [Novosphingobium endophyticum]|uniref:Uncharacterized protein n=1 Tax=Novosphingobium endophyticum TaxID=1955250 RepID=A0A916X4F6_9SPHN|nr:hypothetical protein GCM10011494_07910 [Novosphingobium endophyticum]